MASPSTIVTVTCSLCGDRFDVSDHAERAYRREGRAPVVGVRTLGSPEPPRRVGGVGYHCRCSTSPSTSSLGLYAFASSLRLLVHEAIHQRGSADEGQTECSAMHEMPRVAVRYFGVRAGKQLQALMAQAWRSHRATPPQFQAVC